MIVRPIVLFSLLKVNFMLLWVTRERLIHRTMLWALGAFRIRRLRRHHNHHFFWYGWHVMIVRPIVLFSLLKVNFMLLWVTRERLIHRTMLWALGAFRIRRLRYINWLFQFSSQLIWLCNIGVIPCLGFCERVFHNVWSLLAHYRIPRLWANFV